MSMTETIGLGEFSTDLFKTSGTSPPAAKVNLGEFPAHLFGPQDPPVPRFHISDDLWNGYTLEQVAKQRDRMIETGRWLLPNGGGRFVVRLTIQALRDIFEEDALTVPDAINAQLLYDFEFAGDDFVDTTIVFKKRYSNCPRDEKQRALEEFARHTSGAFSDNTDKSRAVFASAPKWWEDEWMCFRLHSFMGDRNPETRDAARDVLIIALQDRKVQKVEAQPRKPSKLCKLGIGKKRHEDPPKDAPEITLYCPRHVSTADHGGTHASPRMHFRAEHVRKQPYGPRSNPSYREIVIDGKWINAADVDTSELGTPIKLYKLVAGA